MTKPFIMKYLNLTKNHIDSLETWRHGFLQGRFITLVLQKLDLSIAANYLRETSLLSNTWTLWVFKEGGKKSKHLELTEHLLLRLIRSCLSSDPKQEKHKRNWGKGGARTEITIAEFVTKEVGLRSILGSMTSSHPRSFLCLISANQDWCTAVID